MLLNIDKPLKTAMLHATHCSFVPKPYGTELKPVESIGRDGGWFAVESAEMARTVATREYAAATFRLCGYCIKEERL